MEGSNAITDANDGVNANTNTNTDAKRLEAFEKALTAMRDDLREADETLQELKAQGKVKTATYGQLKSRKMMLGTALRYFEEL